MTTLAMGDAEQMAKRDKFLTSQQIEDEWRIWKDTGEMTEQLGRYALLLATKLTGKPQFIGYPQYMKDEMVSDAVLKILKNLHNLDPQKGSLFAYWTQIAYTAFLDYLTKHYKRLNQKKRLLKEQMEELQQEVQNRHICQEVINYLERLLQEYEPSKHNEEEEEQS